MKFLVIWSLHMNLLSPDMMKAVLRQPDYAQKLEAEGKVEKRYHIVGGHGELGSITWNRMRSWSGCWPYPLCYNFAEFKVYPLAEMGTETYLTQEEK